MHDLIELDPALPDSRLTVAEIDATMEFAEAEKAASTRAALDWCDFSAWCAFRDASPLPAHPGMGPSGLAVAGLAAKLFNPLPAKVGGFDRREV